MQSKCVIIMWIWEYFHCSLLQICCFKCHPFSQHGSVLYKQYYDLKIPSALGTGLGLKRLKSSFSIPWSSPCPSRSRIARCHRVRVGHSWHGLAAPADDVHHSPARRVLHRLGARGGHDPNAHLAADQVSAACAPSPSKTEQDPFGSVTTSLQLSNAYICAFYEL